MDKSSYEIRIQEWIKVIHEANSSELTRQAWCSQNGIPLRKFYYWQQRVRKYLLEQHKPSDNVCSKSALIPSQGTDPDAVPAFYEVKSSFPETPELSFSSSDPVSEGFSPEAMIRYGQFGILVGHSITEKTLSTILAVIRHA